MQINDFAMDALDGASPDAAGWRARQQWYALQAELTAEQLRDRREERDQERRARRAKTYVDYLRVALNAGIVLAGLALAIGALLMVVNAARSRNVVIQAFDAPPMLVARGLSGKVVASAVQDEFVKLQRKVRSEQRQNAVTTAWSQEIEVEVPRTGLSIGQIDQLLRRLLGNDTEIGGDVVMLAPDRLALTVRGSDIPARRFEGSLAALPDLARQAAEYAYGEAEPVLMTIYLNQQQRWQESHDFIKRKLETAVDPHERAEYLRRLGLATNALGQTESAIDITKAALALEPTNWLARDTLVSLLKDADRLEEAASVARRMLAEIAALPNGRRPRFYGMNALMLMGDWEGVDRVTGEQNRNVAGGANIMDAREDAVENAVRLRDWRRAERGLAMLDPERPVTKALRLLIAARRAEDEERWPAAVAAYRALERYQDEPDARFGYYAYEMGYALRRAGLRQQADAFARASTDMGYYDRLDRARAYAGPDTIARAERELRGAIALAPSMPDAWQLWGTARLVAGDAGGAAARFRRAIALAPRWAEPRKGLGDALAAQGRWREAAAAYRAALPLAPAWARLRRAADAADRSARRSTAALAGAMRRA